MKFRWRRLPLALLLGTIEGVETVGVVGVSYRLPLILLLLRGLFVPLILDVLLLLMYRYLLMMRSILPLEEMPHGCYYSM